MPMITVDVAGDPDAQLTRRIVETVTTLTARVLGKDPRVTAVAVTYLPRRQWFVAGRSTEELGRAAFFVQVRVVEGTNTKDEKARFLAEAFRALRDALGEVDEESYVHVIEVRGDAYGYGGRTQAARQAAARSA